MSIIMLIREGECHVRSYVLIWNLADLVITLLIMNWLKNWLKNIFLLKAVLTYVQFHIFLHFQNYILFSNWVVSKTTILPVEAMTTIMSQQSTYLCFTPLRLMYWGWPGFLKVSWLKMNGVFCFNVIIKWEMKNSTQGQSRISGNNFFVVFGFTPDSQDTRMDKCFIFACHQWISSQSSRKQNTLL